MSPLWKKDKLYLLNWAVYNKCIDILVTSLTGIDIDLIIGIARGGLVPAVSLSHRLNVPDLLMLGVRRNLSDDSYPPRGEPSIVTVDETQVSGRELVLIDDIVGDGATMRLAVSEVQRHNPKKIITASLVLNVEATFQPDFYILSVDDWVVFPWEDNPARPETRMEWLTIQGSEDAENRSDF